MIWVSECKYLGDYKVLVVFDDGCKKVVDLKETVKDGEIFEPLKDIKYFSTVRFNPELETICWDNGADLAPEYLYEIGVEIKEDTGTHS